MTNWTGQTKNTASATFQSKNSTTFTGQNRSLQYSFLKRENGDYLLKEDSGKMRITDGTTTFAFTYQTRN